MSLEVFLGGVHFLVQAGFAGEEDEALPVGLEAGDIGGEGFFREVGAAGVDGDTNGGGEGAGNTCFLDTEVMLAIRYFVVTSSR